MEEYHTLDSLSSGEYSDSSDATTAPRNPFAYEVVPPIGRLLDVIRADRSIGGCFRPGNRWLADQMGYASASPIPSLLSQLAFLGWINYDSASGVIMLLRDYASDQAIRSSDQQSGDQIDRSDDGDSALIDPSDRVFAHQNAECESDHLDRSNPQCMEDSCLAADSDSAAARPKIPCTAETISRIDHPASLLLAELGTNATLRARAIACRPDLTPEQVRATWAHFEQRVASGRCTAAAFHAAIANGEIHAAPPDPQRPLDPAAYAGDSFCRLGSDMTGLEVESIGDIARRILPADASGADWVFVQTRLARGDSEAGALHALAERRSAVRR